MVFSSPDWASDIPWEIPDSIPLGQFSLEGLARNSQQESTRPLLIDGISGKSYFRAELHERVEFLAGGLAKELGWSPNEGSPWEKVVAIYSLNTVRTIPFPWGIESSPPLQDRLFCPQLGCAPLEWRMPSYSPDELGG